jgi:hypothetical protein
MKVVYRSPVATLYPAMPTFYLSGHAVTMGGHDAPMAGASALLADVMDWYKHSLQ